MEHAPDALVKALQERADFCDFADDWSTEAQLMRQAAASLADSRRVAEQMAGALREFGRHKLSCAWRKPRPSNFMKRACDCGLDAALAAYDGGKP